VIEDAELGMLRAQLEESEQQRIASEQQRVLVEERVAALHLLNTQLEGRIAALESALINTTSEYELLKRRLFGVKSERTQTNELQLMLGDLLQEQARLQHQLDELTKRDGKGAEGEAAVVHGDEPASPPAPPPRGKPSGRRDLKVSSLPIISIELTDPKLEESGQRMGFEESRQLMFQRGGFRVLVKRIAKYAVEQDGLPRALTLTVPPTLLRRSLAHGSVIARIATQKFALGVPHYRLEQHEPELDRGTMGRYMEELGNTLGATVVHAMLRDALEHSGVLSTDATGAAIQRNEADGPLKRSCKKGHFFTIVADATHVLYVYTEKHDSAFVAELFKDYRGFLQADASSVYDILERGPPKDDDETKIQLVGCWAHCRRYFFEAALRRYPIGIEGLVRTRAIFRADAALAGLPPSERRRRRLQTVKPLVDDFFDWVKREGRQNSGRNFGTRALGYAMNQEDELLRVFLDGRLPLDNTRSERALRRIVVGRKNWMFYGTDTHAEAAAAIFSIISSCRLHGLDVEGYLEEVMRALPNWPRERYLELAPANWAATRAALDPTELSALVLPITAPGCPKLGLVETRQEAASPPGLSAARD
jgi:transposase